MSLIIIVYLLNYNLSLNIITKIFSIMLKRFCFLFYEDYGKIN
jgi:hypothetical protein